MTDEELYEYFKRKADSTPMPGAHECFMAAANAFKERVARQSPQPLTHCFECVKYQTKDCAAKHEQALTDFCSHGIRKPGGEQT